MNYPEMDHTRFNDKEETKFIADAHLGKLSRYLRLLGFDTYFDTSLSDKDIIGISLSGNRMILSRDKELIRNSEAAKSYQVMDQDPKTQLKDIVDNLGLKGRINPFTRCMECNAVLVDVKKEDVFADLPHKTREYYDKFMQCSGCSKIYWQGSHFEKMNKLIKDLTDM